MIDTSSSLHAYLRPDGSRVQSSFCPDLGFFFRYNAQWCFSLTCWGLVQAGPGSLCYRGHDCKSFLRIFTTQDRDKISVDMKEYLILWERSAALADAIDLLAVICAFCFWVHISCFSISRWAIFSYEQQDISAMLRTWKTLPFHLLCSGMKFRYSASWP